MAHLKNVKVFIEELVNTFPEIRDEVFEEDYQGVLTWQIGCFERFTQKAVNNNDLATVKRCLDFVELNMNAVQFKIENSLVISYLGKLNFKENQNVEKSLPVSLKDIISELNNYYLSLSKDEKLNRFLKDLDS
ncbi:MAG TPA: hypothetical protein VGI43_00840 [Mucilaginibacter sp.]|jgi:hypothetical protein